MARGSLAEVETYLELIRRLNYADDEVTAPAKSLAGEVGRMLSRLLQRLAGQSP